MKKTSLLVVVGVVVLASACKEDSSIPPALPSTYHMASPNQIELILARDSVYIETGKVKSVKASG